MHLLHLCYAETPSALRRTIGMPYTYCSAQEQANTLSAHDVSHERTTEMAISNRFDTALDLMPAPAKDRGAGNGRFMLAEVIDQLSKGLSAAHAYEDARRHGKAPDEAAQEVFETYFGAHR